MEAQQVTTKRDVQAVMIPEGDQVTIPSGTVGWITQALGGTFTVQLATGRKYRVEGADADALGKRPEDSGAAAAGAEEAEPLEPEEAEKEAWKAMKQVHDPEIPVNLVDLGLIYSLKMHKRGDGKLFAEVKMSLTAPGCGMGDILVGDVERAIKAIPGVAAVDAKIVFDPIWNPAMMSEGAKLKLGML